jgi:hypothetical protein
MIEIQNHEHILRLSNYSAFQTIFFFSQLSYMNIAYSDDNVKFLSREAFNLISTMFKFVNTIREILKIEEKQTCHEKIMCLFFGPN